MVGFSGARSGELSLVGRVRRLLVDMEQSELIGGDPGAEARLLRAQELGTASRDLEAIDERLQLLKASFPEIAGVETGPHLQCARQLFFCGSAG